MNNSQKIDYILLNAHQQEKSASYLNAMRKGLGAANNAIRGTAYKARRGLDIDRGSGVGKYLNTVGREGAGALFGKHTPYVAGMGATATVLGSNHIASNALAKRRLKNKFESLPGWKQFLVRQFGGSEFGL